MKSGENTEDRTCRPTIGRRSVLYPKRVQYFNYVLPEIRQPSPEGSGTRPDIGVLIPIREKWTPCFEKDWNLPKVFHWGLRDVKWRSIWLKLFREIFREVVRSISKDFRSLQMCFRGFQVTWKRFFKSVLEVFRRRFRSLSKTVHGVLGAFLRDFEDFRGVPMGLSGFQGEFQGVLGL